MLSLDYTQSNRTDFIVLTSVDPTCDNRLLLHFPYEVNFDDVTCHKAKGYSYGEGEVKIVYDADRDQNVAQFDGMSRIEVRFNPCIHLVQPSCSVLVPCREAKYVYFLTHPNILISFVSKFFFL